MRKRGRTFLVRLLACLLVAACADYQARPTFPVDAAGKPVISEQAVLGISEAGDAAVAQLTDADGQPPDLALIAFNRAGGPAKPIATAGEKAARAVAQRVREAGRRPSPILAAAL